MAEQNPTVIIAHLDDEKLRKSIDSLVGYVDEKFKTMTTSTTNAVNTMQQSLNKLGELKITSTGSGGESRATAIKKEKKEVEDLKLSYDQMAQALQKATRYPSEMRMQDQSKSARDSYLAFMQGYKAHGEAIARQIQDAEGALNRAVQNRVADLNAKLDNAKKKLNELYTTLYQEQEKARSAGTLGMPFNAGIARTQQAIEYAKKHIEELNAAIAKVSPNMFTEQVQQIEQLRARRERVLDTMKEEVTTQQQSAQVETQQLNIDTKRTEELQKQIGLIQSRGEAKKTFENAAAMPVDTYEQAQGKLRVLESLKEKVANTPLFSKNQTQALGDEIEKVRVKMSFLYRTTEEGVAEEKARVAAQQKLMQDRLVQIEKEKAALKERGLAAQQSANAIREAMRDQLQDNMATGTQQAISGLKDLQQHIRDMQRAFGAMNQEEQESPIGRALKNDIRLAREAMVAVSKYNLSAVTGRQTPVAGLERFDSYKLLSQRVSRLTKEYQDLTAAERDAEKGKGMAEKIQLFSRALQEIQRQMSRPISLKNAWKLEENTLDRIAYKMQQLTAYKMGLDITDQKQVGEMRSVETEIDRLKKKQDELMGKNQQLMSSNNALARSWNYMKNRLAFYFTVGASTQFVKNLIEVRSQYEMNERALGILIDSAERGTQIFNELSQMALVSPYTLIELSSAAKQLTAYDVAANDVVDTTRRLADMASAVGVPIERLTYALGQIKAYGYLNSRDARMFLNAGIPLVKSLADHYTELEGRMVSVADVYDRMKKKAISYNDVMAVITEMTDEGGKFFDFQAKMADTLKVQLANLTLAWNNMLNEIGKSEQGVLVGGIKGLKELFLQWEKINTLVRNLAITFGFAKLLQVIQIATLGMDAFGKKMVWQILVGKKLQVVLYNIAGSLKAIVSSPLTWWALLATAVVSAGMALYDANKALKEFNKSIADGGKENYENTKKFLQQYQDLRNGLQIKNGTLKDSRTTTSTGVSKDEAEKAWAAIREQIELTSQSSDYFIGKLLSNYDDVNKRVEKGFDYLQKIQDVYGAMSSMDDDTIAIKETYKDWWNLGLAQDGVIGNLKEYIATKKLAEEEEKKGAAWLETETVFAKRIESLWSSADIALQQYRDDLDVTLESMANFAQTQGFDVDQEKEFFSQTINKIVTSRNLGEKEALQFRLDAEERYKDARIKQFDEVIEFETKRAGEAAAGAEKDRLLLRVKAAQQEKKEWLANQEGMYGEGRVLFEGFTKYMTRNHGSELQKLFGNMSKKEIEQINWSEPRWKKWAKDNAKAFAEQFGVSFDKLKKYVNDANRMTIFIRTIVQKPDDKSVYDTLTEADKAADEAWNKIQRLKTHKGELESKGAIVAGTREIDTDYANTLQEITEAQEDYNAALAKGGHSKKENTTNTKAQKQAETELQKALKDELQLLDKVRSQYKKLTDAGVDGTTALNMVTNQFTNSIQRINNILGRNGLPLFNIKAFAGTDNPNAVLEMLKKQLDAAKVAKNIKPEEIKELEVKYGEIVIDAKVYNTKKITDGLNNELSKIKDEYELAVELDANPELGGAFADLFGINTDELPRTFGEAFDKANKIAMEKLQELKVDVKDFDLLSTIIKGDDKGMWMGHKLDSEPIQKLIAKQKEWRDMLKKNLTETEKALDDYVKKYGGYSDKIAEIEADRIEKIKRLNDAYYTEEMRKLPEYIAKLNAIEQGAIREKGNAGFEDFKNSRLYVQMFEDLRFASTATLETMRDKLSDLKSELGSLTPEQLKQVTQQFEKIEQELTRRNPFKGFTTNAKNYLRAIGKEGKEAQKNFRNAQKEYDTQQKVLATIKTKLKQAEAAEKPNKENIAYLKEELGVQQEIVDKLYEQFMASAELNEKFNLFKKIFGEEQAGAIAKWGQVVASNLQSLGELRDFIQQDLGVELSDELNGTIDGLTKVGEGINSIVSSATSGNVVGVIAGVGKTVYGLYDSIASIFGGGSAGDKKISRQIEESERHVKALEISYQDLQDAMEDAYGYGEVAAKRATITNKELQLVELQRQLQLEKSRKKKNQDANRIMELQSAIINLRNELDGSTKDIVNDLLGISSVGDAAEQLVSSMIDAFKNGEDYMKVYEDSFEDMIDNLIMKAIVGEIVGRKVQQMFDAVEKESTKRADKTAYSAKMPSTRDMLEELYPDYGITEKNIRDYNNIYFNRIREAKTFEEVLSAYEKSQADALQRGEQNFYDMLQKQKEFVLSEYADAATIRPEDLRVLTPEWKEQWMEGVDDMFKSTMDALGITFGEGAEKSLSNLQQGLQSMSEETGSALESYMNGVSQQVYLQSDLLTQIRDAVVAFDNDVQVATNAQILLQLQQSYAVQMAIQSILMGWSTPSGMAVRVELNS